MQYASFTPDTRHTAGILLLAVLAVEYGGTVLVWCDFSPGDPVPAPFSGRPRANSGRPALVTPHRGTPGAVGS
jgi:hypothetical protein